MDVKFWCDRSIQGVQELTIADGGFSFGRPRRVGFNINGCDKERVLEWRAGDGCILDVFEGHSCGITLSCGGGKDSFVALA
jgi:hypothetical protein